MNEQLYPPELVNSRIDKTYNILIDEIEIQSYGGPNVELPTAAMFRALINSDEKVHKFLKEMSEWVLEKRHLDVGPAASLFRTSLIDFFSTYYESRGKEFFYSDLTNEDDWEEHMKILSEALENNDDQVMEILYSDLIFRNAPTPAKERSYTDELIGQLISERFPNGATGLDYGCSLGLGSLQLLYKEEYPMQFESVISDEPKKEDLTDKANSLLSRSKIFSTIVGMDQYPYYHNSKKRYDPAITRFALNGLRPSERNSTNYMDTLNALLNKKNMGSKGYDENSPYSFFEGNLLNERDFSLFRENFSGTFDIIMANFVTQEVPPRERRLLHDKLCSLLSYNGVLIYNHQAYRTPGTVKKARIINIKHYKHYATKPYRSRMHVLDMLQVENGIQEIAHSYDNRLRRLMLKQSGKLVVNGNPEPVEDLVRNA